MPLLCFSPENYAQLSSFLDLPIAQYLVLKLLCFTLLNGTFDLMTDNIRDQRRTKKTHQDSNRILSQLSVLYLCVWLVIRGGIDSTKELKISLILGKNFLTFQGSNSFFFFKKIVPFHTQIHYKNMKLCRCVERVGCLQ